MRRAAIRNQFGAFAGAIVATALLTGSDAFGQYALGGGNRLDANLGVGTGRINAPRAVEDFRARNLIVTGNVAGGRGFRGSVGYGAEGDFRDFTGVDDLFTFRADAALSSPRLIGTPGWQQLRLGREFGALSIRRGDGGVSAGQLQEQIRPERREELLPERFYGDLLRHDAALAQAGTAARVDAPIASRPIGYTVIDEGRLVAFEASPLRGVTPLALDDPRARFGLSQYDLARLREERPAATPADLIRRHETNFTSLLDAGRIEPGTAEARIPSMVIVDESMAGILDRIARRYTGRDDVIVHFDPRLVEQLDDEYRELRDRLRRLSPADRLRVDPEHAAGDRLDLEVDLDEPWMPRTDHLDPLPGTEIGLAQEEEEEEDFLAQAPVGEPIPRGELDRLFAALRHGERLEQLATEGNSRFDELMAEAEQFLREGEFFHAERRFLRALRIIPGHPLAFVGTAHAQLGAGLQLPASLSIRRMLSAHPELIDVRYESSLLPSRPRLVQVLDAAEARVRRMPADKGEYGLVIAYIGHQIEDVELVQRGLELMAEANPDDPFVTVLRSVWLAEEREENAARQPQENGQMGSSSAGSAPEK